MTQNTGDDTDASRKEEDEEWFEEGDGTARFEMGDSDGGEGIEEGDAVDPFADGDDGNDRE